MHHDVPENAVAQISNIKTCAPETENVSNGAGTRSGCETGFGSLIDRRQLGPMKLALTLQSARRNPVAPHYFHFFDIKH